MSGRQLITDRAGRLTTTSVKSRSWEWDEGAKCVTCQFWTEHEWLDEEGRCELCAAAATPRPLQAIEPCLVCTPSRASRACPEHGGDW